MLYICGVAGSSPANSTLILKNMKTIEEGLEEAYQKAGENAYFGNGFKSGVEFAQRWISVEDELPKEGVSVLIKNDFGCFGINVLENGFWRMCTVEKIAGLLNLKEYELERFATPTHWRPIELK